MRASATWLRPALLVMVSAAVAGLALDVWSHSATERVETFFTPWHIPLYASVAAAYAMVARDRLRQTGRLRWSLWGDTGIAVMAAGGVVDAFWHELAGIEDSVEGFFSLPHLLIFAGLFLMAAGPVQVVLRDNEVPSRLLLLPMVAAAVDLTIATSWATPFTRQPGFGLTGDAVEVAAGVGAWMVHAAILGGLVTVAARTWPGRPAFVAATAAAWWTGGALVASRPQQALLALPIAVAIVLAMRITTQLSSPARPALVAGAAALAGVGAWFVGGTLTGSNTWSIHLISGAVTWSVLTAAGVARLLDSAISPTTLSGPIDTRDHAVL